MEKSTFKYIFPLVVFLASLTLIIFSSFFSYLEKQRANEIISQRLLLEQQILKAKIEAEEKIYLMGKFDPSTREDFASVPEEYNIGGYKMYLRKEVLDAFSKMKEAAKKDGVTLAIASATRNFEYQKNLWNNKWNALSIGGGERFKKILEYSAVPGTSRHHWGTDIDINAATPEYFKTSEGALVYEWLNKNAPLFGFCQPYNAKGPNRPTGYNEEKWHWSYLPIAKNLTQKYINLIQDEELVGFLGEEYALEQNLINNYVLGINSECF
ncbi:MAG: M15 family metallopeptidase [Minisyncoccia bacterium]